MPQQGLHFQENIHEKLKRTFKVAWEGFTPLHRHTVHLRKGNMENVTMRAQPLINWQFFTTSDRHYKVEFQPRPQFDPRFKLEDLPADVLIGWFAHELGHIIDYLKRPWYDLIKLGVAYSTLPIYRTGVERRADLFAIEYGYVDYIQATKRYLLKESNIPNDYLDRITRYYMSPEEVEKIILQEEGKGIDRDSIV